MIEMEMREQDNVDLRRLRRRTNVAAALKMRDSTPQDRIGQQVLPAGPDQRRRVPEPGDAGRAVLSWPVSLVHRRYIARMLNPLSA